MRSSTEDLTTQARIRDAAIALFPAHGIKGTTVRAVADSAGVSPGLVIHYFGSKEGLHRACDQYVVQQVMELKRDALESGSYRQPGGVAELYQLAEPTIGYLAWTLSSGNETSTTLFESMVDEAVSIMEDPRFAQMMGEGFGDRRRQAAVLVAHQLSSLVFHKQLSRVLGVEMLTAEGLLEVAPYVLQIYSGDLFNREVIAQTREALDAMNLQREASR